MTPHAPRVLATMSGVLALALAACSGPVEAPTTPAASDDASPLASTAPSPSLRGFYGQKITWKQCDLDAITPDGVSKPDRDAKSYQCATVRAPLDWSKPAGRTIELSLARHRASGQSQGVLFYNLGGPGAGAVDSLAWVATQALSQDLVDHYDIVGMDPRGVGGSTPITCLTDQQRDDYTSSQTEADQQDAAAIVAELEAQSREFGQRCLKRSGDLARHVDTASAARDFDMARALLGQSQLDYLGFSYGTFLGATYADLFPRRVGRFVLDGALDPSMSIDQVSDAQIRGFDQALGHWAERCEAGATGSQCPVSGGVDGAKSQIAQLLKRLKSSPLPTSNSHRSLTLSLAITGIIGSLYSSDSYPLLTQALTQALQHDDGSTLLVLADYYNDREQDGTYKTNSVDAQVAINSLDYAPVGTVAQWKAAARRLGAEAPVFGPYAGYASASLSAWPIQTHAKRTALHARGANPIVVVGTTHDPATPYAMAQDMARDLDSGVLVTWNGWNHTAYSRDGSSCVRETVDAYLVDGTIPRDGTYCGQ